MIDGNIDVLSLEGQIVDSISLEGDLLPIGPKGDKGDPGFSPVVTVSKNDKTTTIKFETATGNVYAYIQDGEDGQGSGDMLTDVYDKNKNGIVDNAEKVNGKTVEENVPANAKFTDTIYDDTEVRNLINAKPDFTDIPTNVSELTNDAHYVSSDGASTVSGENTELSLNGTTEGMFKELDLKGNTSQKTLSGKNKFDKDNADVIGAYFAYNITGQLTTSNSDKTVIISCKSNTTYTISKITSTRFRVGVNDTRITSGLVNNAIYNDGKTSITITTGSNDVYLYVQYYTGTNSQEAQEILNSIQVEEGSTATSYEEYCGGILSPNPDYPQDVNNVSGTNEIIVCGKNLFDKTSITLGQRLDPNGLDFPDVNCFVSDYIMVKPNSIYIRNVEPSVYQSVALYRSDKTFISRSSTTQTITTTNDTKYIRLCAYNENLDVLQFELGNQATTYEAYNGAIYNIDLPSGMELNKIGTYQDYIYKENDKWYILKKIGTKVLDSSDSSWFESSAINNHHRYVCNADGNADQSIRCYSNYFYGVSRANFTQANQMCIINTGVQILTDTFTTINDFKAWLSNHNVVGYYILATSTNIEITDTTLISQLNTLYKAYTYKNQTNISQSNNDLPFILNVEAFTDTYNGRYENIINMIKKVQ